MKNRLYRLIANCVGVLSLTTLVLCSRLVNGQTFKINLSPKHDQKLSAIKSGHKRMMKYYKFYSKDSAAHLKQKDKQTKKQTDSLKQLGKQELKLTHTLRKRGVSEGRQYAYCDSLQNELKECQRIQRDSTASDSAKRTASGRIKQIRKNRINYQLAQHGHPGKVKFQKGDSLKQELKKWWAVMKDSASSDSLKTVAKEKVKSIAIEQALHDPRFQGMYEEYKQYGQTPDWNTIGQHVPGMDTLKGVFDSSPEQLMKSAEGISTQMLTKTEGLSGFNKQTGAFNDLKGEYKDLSNPEAMKVQDNAQEQAVDHFANQEDKLQAAQQKMNGVLSKYKEFTDSNNLSKAVKRNSLEGKKFWERLVIGGNFNIVSTDPVALDMAPQLGYKFNTKFYLGVSVNYRHTFNDSIKYKWYVSPSNTSLRAFANYDLIKNFFVYAEAERAGLKVKANDVLAKQWKNNYFIGLGKKLLIHPKVYMTITALYNLNNEKNNPTYTRRFQVRIGFQLSELALRKKKINYEH